MAVAGVMMFILVGSIFLGLFVLTLFLMLGARIAGIEKRSFGKALLSVILGMIVSFVFSIVLAGVPLLGQALAFFGGFLAQALVVMPVFQTSFGKALGASILAWVFSLLIFGILAAVAIVFFGGLAAFSQEWSRFAVDVYTLLYAG